jgi:hypothetical protein
MTATSNGGKSICPYLIGKKKQINPTVSAYARSGAKGANLSAKDGMHVLKSPYMC